MGNPVGAYVGPDGARLGSFNSDSAVGNSVVGSKVGSFVCGCG